jgi:hypothetical protein
MRIQRAALFGLGMLAACASTPHIVPLLRVAGAPVTPNINAPLEVVSRSTGVPDPLPVRNSDFEYGDLEGALGIAVSTAAAPWAQAHREDDTAKHGGWKVMVDMVSAEANLEPGGRIVISLDVRATLRTRSGNVYLGQTQVGCRDGGLVSADQGAPVLYRCMMHMGRDLVGWLDGVRLDPPPPGQG